MTDAVRYASSSAIINPSVMLVGVWYEFRLGNQLLAVRKDADGAVEFFELDSRKRWEPCP